MSWTSLDTWIARTAAITAMACAVPGTFLFLSRQSMMSHGVAHSVLPGIVIAFLITHERNWWSLLIGAIVAGILTGVLTRFFQRFGRVEPGAALGITFTSLFALGLVMVRMLADYVHIEPSHVLYGYLEMSVLDVTDPPAVVWRGLGMLAVNLMLMLIFFKELRIATFDYEHAAALGFHPLWVQYGIMAVTATTAVVAFEAVGSILVIAMMIVPPATAYLMTKNLKRMLVLALVIGAATSFLGHLVSITWIGSISGLIFQMKDIGATNSAGGIAVVSCLVFLIALVWRGERQVGF